MMKKRTVLTITAVIVMSLVLLASCDPPMKETPEMLSVKAAQMVQKEVMATQMNVNAANDLYTNNDQGGLNADTQAKFKSAAGALASAKLMLEATGSKGLMKLAKNAAIAASKVKGITTLGSKAFKALQAAEAVKAAADDTTVNSAQDATSKASSEVGDGSNPLTDHGTDQAAITAAKTAVDALKALSDLAVEAAKAVK